MIDEEKMQRDAIKQVDKIIEDLGRLITSPEITSKPGALARYQEAIDNFRKGRADLEKGTSVQ